MPETVKSLVATSDPGTPRPPASAAATLSLSTCVTARDCAIAADAIIRLIAAIIDFMCTSVVVSAFRRTGEVRLKPDTTYVSFKWPLACRVRAPQVCRGPRDDDGNSQRDVLP